MSAEYVAECWHEGCQRGIAHLAYDLETAHDWLINHLRREHQLTVQHDSLTTFHVRALTDDGLAIIGEVRHATQSRSPKVPWFLTAYDRTFLSGLRVSTKE